MSNRTSPILRWRTQFSLRALLLIMAIVSIGLTIYRWPWVEVSTRGWVAADPLDPFARTLTAAPAVDPFGDPPNLTPVKPDWEYRITYRRNWQGQRVKHGPAEYWSQGRLQTRVEFYENELHGPQKQANEKGEVVLEEVLRVGRRHGPFRTGNGKEWLWEGNYANGRWHGMWKCVTSDREYHLPYYSRLFHPDGSPTYHYSDFEAPHENPIVLKSEWRDGQRHGRWVWETPEGKAIDTAEFHQDELVSWNGQPVVARFRQWLKGMEKDEPELVATLAATDLQQWCWRGRWEEKLIFQVGDPLEEGRMLTIHFAGTDGWLDSSAECGRFLPYLCEIAAKNHCRFAVRYGGLWIVRDDPKHWPAADPTGIAEIKLPADTQEEREWHEKIAVLSSNGGLSDCLRAIFQGTHFTFNISAVNADPMREVGTENDRLWRVDIRPQEGEVLYRCRRSDALGLALFLADCRGELVGSELVITPRGKGLWNEPAPYPHWGANPLLPPNERSWHHRIQPQ